MKKVFAVLLLCMSGWVFAQGTKVDPHKIDWPTGAAGCVYAPGTNTCVPAGGSSGISGTYPLTGVMTLANGAVQSVGSAFAMTISCTAAAASPLEVGNATTNPNLCTLGYSNGTPASGTIDDGTHTTTLTTPYTTGNLAYSYTASTTFTGHSTSTTSQTASASASLTISPCTFSGVTSNAAPSGATASGSGAGNQCASETSTLTGGGTLASNGLGATQVGQVFTFSAPAGGYPTLLLTETGSGCNRNPFTFNGSSPVNGTTHAISSYTNILGGVQPNMCLYTFGPYSSAVTLEVTH